MVKNVITNIDLELFFWTEHSIFGFFTCKLLLPSATSVLKIFLHFIQVIFLQFIIDLSNKLRSLGFNIIEVTRVTRHTVSCNCFRYFVTICCAFRRSIPLVCIIINPFSVYDERDSSCAWCPHSGCDKSHSS